MQRGASANLAGAQDLPILGAPNFSRLSFGPFVWIDRYLMWLVELYV
jgi:hypothetical protein